MTLYNAQGGGIVGNDDSRGPDSYFRVTIPADGEYLLSVTDHLQRGGPGFVYRVEFTGGLNTAWDDGLSDDNFLFASSNSGAGTVNAFVGQNDADIEALLLTGVGVEGVTNANLGNAALVSAAFNAEFNITAGNGEDALLVVNDTNGNSFGLYQWVQAGGGETAAGELTLIGIFNGNATVTTNSFDFV